MIKNYENFINEKFDNYKAKNDIIMLGFNLEEIETGLIRRMGKGNYKKSEMPNLLHLLQSYANDIKEVVIKYSKDLVNLIIVTDKHLVTVKADNFGVDLESINKDYVLLGYNVEIPYKMEAIERFLKSGDLQFAKDKLNAASYKTQINSFLKSVEKQMPFWIKNINRYKDGDPIDTTFIEDLYQDFKDKIRNKYL